MTNAKTIMVVVLAVIALLINVGIAQLLPAFMSIVYISLALSTFGLLVIAFDFWLWRIPLFYSVGLVEHPYIGGRWVGNLTTSYDDQSRITDIEVYIHQHWTTLKVDFYSATANSTSLSASLFVQPSGVHTLTYIYDSRPNAKAPPTLVPHIGLTVLRLNDAGRLTGYYHYLYQDEKEQVVIRGQIVLQRHADALVPEAKL
jgi:hypothetical protein